LLLLHTKNHQLLPNHNQENTNKQPHTTTTTADLFTKPTLYIRKNCATSFQASTAKRAPSSQHKQSKTKQDNKTQICEERITTSLPHQGLSLIQ